ncbi:MAG TPA: hypothetical protein VF216_03115 [Mizugakiibacter sp.]
MTPPPPAECRAEALRAYPAHLGSLPADFARQAPDAQARALLALKAADAQTYLQLRAQAVRCAAR